MLEIISSLDQSKKSNLVVILKNRFDFEKFIPYGMTQKHIDKMEALFVAQKNTKITFFVGREDFEEITFFVYLDTNESLLSFVTQHIESLPNNLTFSYYQDNILLDSILLRKYEYDFYKSEKKDFDFFVEVSESNLYHFEERYKTLLCMMECRDLVNKPANDKTPDKYVQIVKALKFKNIKVKVLEYEEIKRQGM
jgi:leucyl aminopeptidase